MCLNLRYDIDMLKIGTVLLWMYYPVKHINWVLEAEFHFIYDP